jgi:HSP90 family molecular chaperone
LNAFLDRLLNQNAGALPHGLHEAQWQKASTNTAALAFDNNSARAPSGPIFHFPKKMILKILLLTENIDAYLTKNTSTMMGQSLKINHGVTCPHPSAEQTSFSTTSQSIDRAKSKGVMLTF